MSERRPRRPAVPARRPRLAPDAALDGAPEAGPARERGHVAPAPGAAAPGLLGPPSPGQLAGLLAASSADALFMLDGRGHVTWMNPAAERLFGWSQAELAGRTLHAAVHARRPDGSPFPARDCPLGRVVATGETVAHHEDTFFHRDGTPVPVLCSNAPVRVDGQLAGAALSVHDLRARRAVSEAVRQRVAFEQQLVGIVSHDLRNPLNAIALSAASLLRRPGALEREHGLLTRIADSAARANRMIHDLLDFTQARLGGALPVSPRACDLHAVVRQAVDEAQAAHPQRRLQLSSEGDGRGRWDPDRLAQLVTNLVGNALQYSPAGSTVQVVTREAEGGELELCVHNTGEPIPEALLPQLFEPLTRGSTAARRGGSIGLGLFIVHHIVQAHAGRIEVCSSCEDGTRFRVFLPRRSRP